MIEVRTIFGRWLEFSIYGSSRRACDVGSFASNLGFESLIIVLDHLRNQPKVIRSLELLFLLVELSWPSIIRLKQLFIFIFKSIFFQLFLFI